MAMTNDYLNYIDAQVDIAPANSQEELNAAQMVADVFGSHGLTPELQEFSAPGLTGLLRGIVQVALFLGIVLAGVGQMALTVVGILLVVAALVLLLLPLFGMDVLAGVGSAAKSQNIIAHHEATGELAAKGNRPVVIVAHYDTPRENLLASKPFSKYQGMLSRAVPICVAVVALCALLQLMTFIPDVARRIVWVLGIVASLPPLLTGVSAIAERFMPCTAGANDNKAALAALMSVLDAVRPSDGVPVSAGTSEAGSAEPSPDDREGTKALLIEPPLEEEPCGVRHGRAMLESLGMLPPDCEITYLEPDSRVSSAVPADATASIPTDDEADSSDPNATTAMDPSMFIEDAPQEEEFEKDSSGLDAISSDEPADGSTAPMAPVQGPAPASVDDPEWGKSTYRPRANNFARRASLFDLPDPSTAEADPLAPETPKRPAPRATSTSASMASRLGEASSRVSSIPDPVRIDQSNMGQTRVAAPQVSAPVTNQSAAPVGDDISVIQPPVSEIPATQEHKKGHLFRRKKNEEPDSMGQWLGVGDDYNAKDDGRSIGSWDNLASQEGEDARSGKARRPHWKGGATRAEGLRDVDSIPADEDPELKEAILQMGDDELISHDIWFVAVGASALDHAGIKAFLDEYRKSIRGAFLINLDCIGAGVPTVLSDEGLFGTRKADRRLVRLLTSTADDLHTPLATQSHAWEDTDATPAMRSSVRSATIVGLAEGGVRALSGTKDDVPEAIDPAQVEDIVQLVTESIRRS